MSGLFGAVIEHVTVDMRFPVLSNLWNNAATINYRKSLRRSIAKKALHWFRKHLFRFPCFITSHESDKLTPGRAPASH